ncbi:hypothetical protein BC826DRAFT_1192401 [Russula brevipes]|nr:hypothetical protein BC826DRAFT_1192401 [Russula brevipes]
MVIGIRPSLSSTAPPPLQMIACSVICQRNVALDATRMPLMLLDIVQMFNVLALVLDTLHPTVFTTKELMTLRGAATITSRAQVSSPGPQAEERGEALPESVPNPPALAAGHPCDFDIRSRGDEDLVSGVPLTSGFTADGNTPRPHLPHLPRIHTQQPTSAASLLPRLCQNRAGTPSISVPIPQLDSALGRTHGLDGTDACCAASMRLDGLRQERAECWRRR